MKTLANSIKNTAELNRAASTRGPMISLAASLLLALSASVWALPTRTAIASGPWQHVTSLPTPRDLLAAVLGPGGKIYTVGGVESDGTDSVKSSNRLEAFDPATNAWTEGASLPRVRDAFAAATGPDGKVYVMGGFVSASFGSRIVDTVEAYDPATNTWAIRAPMPTGLGSFGAVTAPNGKIYAIGGGENADVGAVKSLGKVEVYDTATNSWAAAPSMPIPLAGPAVTLGADGRIYALGGQDANTNPVGTVEAFDPTTSTWSTEKPVPTVRTGHAAATGRDGKIYVLGGDAGTTVEAYNPVTMEWSTESPMPIARQHFSAVAGPDGRIYVLGGDNNGTLVKQVDAYSSNLETSTVFQPILTFTKLSAVNGNGRAQKAYTVGSTVTLRGTYSLRYAPARGVVGIFQTYRYWRATKRTWEFVKHVDHSSRVAKNGVTTFTNHYVIPTAATGVSKIEIAVILELPNFNTRRTVVIGVTHSNR